MRSVLNEDQFTPFGLWLRQYVRKSTGAGGGISITNLDYVVEDFKQKKIMLLEEKQNDGAMNKAQLLTFDVLDYALTHRAAKYGYEYWGFYILKLPHKCTMPGPGMTLNGSVITSEELQSHLNFEKRFCEPLQMKWSKSA